MKWLSRAFALVAIGMSAAGCVAHKPVTFEWPTPDRTVLLMPTDIELSELTAGGVTVLNAEWTQLAKRYFKKTLSDKLMVVNADVVAADDGLNQPQDQVQLTKLHEAVGNAVLLHQPGGLFGLPTKKDAPTWTLGTGAQKLKQRYGADYALFIHIRDSYATGERVAAIIVAAAFGVGIQGGVQQGFASLVDLNTGEVVWHNLLARTSGDMRNPDGARNTADILLKGFPG